MKSFYKNDELISALHKTVRGNDYFLSCYFAKIIKETVGVWRVKQYIFFIALEETMSLELFKNAYNLFSMEDDKITDDDIYEVLNLFCSTKKKWDTEAGQN